MRYFAGSQRLEKKGLSRYGLPRCDGLSSYFASRSTQKNKYSRSPVRPAHLPRHGNTSGQWQSKDSFVALECVYQVGMYFFFISDQPCGCNSFAFGVEASQSTSRFSCREFFKARFKCISICWNVTESILNLIFGCSD